MNLGSKISALRKSINITQETLAQKLNVTNQAVSKWESGQSCPDIALLPQLADIFEISLDALFDRPVPAAPKISLLPWEDDDSYHAVLYRGHTLLESTPDSPNSTLTIKEPCGSVYSAFDVYCDAVTGDVNAGGDVTCSDVHSNVTAQADVTCADVLGHVSANGGVTCDDIHGNAAAGGDITCDDIGGTATAGGDITCDCISGSAFAGGEIVCD